MSGWLLALQCVMYASSTLISLFAFFNERKSFLWISFVIIVVNIILSCTIAWCGITIWLLIVVALIFVSCLSQDTDLEDTLLFVCAFVIFIFGFVCIIINFFAPSLFYIPSDQYSRTEIYTTEIASASDKGIANTSISGTNILLFGNVSGSTTLEYYYSYYYLNDNGNLIIGSIPASKSELCSNDENKAYIKTYETYNICFNALTGFMVDSDKVVSERYELYAPQNAIPRTFQFDLN